MRLRNLYIIPLLFLTLITDMVLGQSKINVNLTIDANCFCRDSLTIEQSGEFGIYTIAEVPKYSGNYADTLIRKIELKEEQIILLEQGTYKFIYTPSDSLKRKSQYYFVLNTYETKIHLNCFFFNKHYPSILDQMDKKDTTVISSTYFGITNIETIIPTYTVVVFRNRKKYFASYYKSEKSGLLIQTQYLKYESQVLLTEEQVQRFKEFEENFLNLSINDNLNYLANSKNYILMNGKRINFDSRGYIALLLWNELSKTSANKK